jgi:hypothetical protein
VDVYRKLCRETKHGGAGPGERTFVLPTAETRSVLLRLLPWKEFMEWMLCPDNRKQQWLDPLINTDF